MLGYLKLSWQLLYAKQRVFVCHVYNYGKASRTTNRGQGPKSPALHPRDQCSPISSLESLSLASSVTHVWCIGKRSHGEDHYGSWATSFLHVLAFWVPPSIISMSTLTRSRISFLTWGNINSWFFLCSVGLIVAFDRSCNNSTLWTWLATYGHPTASQNSEADSRIKLWLLPFKFHINASESMSWYGQLWSQRGKDVCLI